MPQVFQQSQETTRLQFGDPVVVPFQAQADNGDTDADEQHHHEYLQQRESTLCQPAPVISPRTCHAATHPA